MNIKIVSMAIVALFCLNGCRHSPANPVQPKVPVAAVTLDTPAIVEQVKKQFAAINADLPTLIRQKKDLNGMSAEGGEVTGYYGKTGLVKLQAILYGEMGKAEIEAYFDQAKLFFYYKKETQYDKPIYEQGFKVKNTGAQRFYFYEGKVIRWLGAHQDIEFPAAQDFKAKSAEIQEEVRDIQAVLGGKKE